MSPPNTDPWRAAADTDPGSAPATTVDESDASMTREFAPPLAASPPTAQPRQFAPGTDPGLGNPTPATDTVIDATEPGAQPWDEDSSADDDELVAQLKRLGGRPPQHAHFQPDSAGRYAASYDVVTKPVKSRAAAVSRTDPFGVIVAPDTLPPAPGKRAVTEPRIVAAAAAGASPALGPPSSLPPADVTEVDLALIERAQARRQASRALVSTVGRHRARPRSWSRSHAIYGGLILVTIAAIVIGVFVIKRPPSPGVSSISSATAASSVPATPAISRRESTIPIPITSSQPTAAAPTSALSARDPEPPTANRVPVIPNPSSRPRPHSGPGAFSSSEPIPKPAAPTPTQQPSTSASGGGVWRL